MALTQLFAPDTELTINVGTRVETISYLLHSESISPAHNLLPWPPLRRSLCPLQAEQTGFVVVIVPSICQFKRGQDYIGI